MNADPFIRIENLSKCYLEGGFLRPVLMNTTAEIQRGEFIAIVGKSGSGKSTLLNLISGIDRADEGHIYVNDFELTALSDHQRTLFRRQNMGFVFQFFNLIPTLNVLENVSLPLELNGESLNIAVQKAQKLLDSVGLLDRAKAFPDRLSGGEQQRVAIARALVHDPLLVLVDEPTGNLDEATGDLILSLLDHLTRQAGRNLILVTHNQEAASIADRTLCLHEGTLTPLCDD